MTSRLDGKVALISGAARGQGAAEARQFTAAGARVVVSDVLLEEGRNLVRELGDAAAFAGLDVTSEQDWGRAVRFAVETFGQLDVLVNNAGIYSVGPLVEESAESFERHFRVNQLGVFLGMRAAAPELAKTGSGSIVNTSSGGGLRGGPNVISYAATKWAVRGMTKCAAIELAPLGIRVNSIHPGLIDTPMIAGNPREQIEFYAGLAPLKRLGLPEEIAAAAAFLASDAASFITGAELAVDGGATA